MDFECGLHKHLPGQSQGQGALPALPSLPSLREGQLLTEESWESRPGVSTQEQDPLWLAARQRKLPSSQKVPLFYVSIGVTISQGRGKNFLLVSAQWKIYFKKWKLFLRVAFISLSILDPTKTGQLSSYAAKHSLDKLLNKIQSLICHLVSWPTLSLCRG